VYARRQFCANLEVCRPPEPLWNPRLREAATTLEAMRGRQYGGQRTVKIKKCIFVTIKKSRIKII